MDVKTEEFKEYIEEIKASNREQVSLAKKQYYMSLITAAASIIVLAVVLYTYTILMPKVNSAFNNLGTVMDNMETISEELKKADIGSMVTNVDGLVTSSQSDISDALSKINSIDFASLNKAIKDLSDVVAPLAKFADRFSL